jgi:hypothetical protein
MIPNVTSVSLPRALFRLSPSTSAVSAMMPPSPPLSARMMNVTYLTETIIVIDQNTSEITHRHPREWRAPHGGQL